MLRYMSLLSFSISALWSAAHTPSPQPSTAKLPPLEERVFTGYSVVTTKHGRPVFRNEPYGSPLKISSPSILRFMKHCSKNSFESALQLVKRAEKALASQQLSQDDYENICIMCFTSLMNYFQRKYLDSKGAPTNDDLLSSYVDEINKAEQARTLNGLTSEQRHRLTCYKITFLIGAANIAGKLPNNQEQLNFAIAAKNLVSSLPSDIVPAYTDGSNLNRNPTLRTCGTIIERARYFLLAAPKQPLEPTDQSDGLMPKHASHPECSGRPTCSNNELLAKILDSVY